MPTVFASQDCYQDEMEKNVYECFIPEGKITVMPGRSSLDSLSLWVFSLQRARVMAPLCNPIEAQSFPGALKSLITKPHGPE